MSRGVHITAADVSVAAGSHWWRLRGRYPRLTCKANSERGEKEPQTHADAAPSGDAARAHGALLEETVPRPADHDKCRAPPEIATP